MAKDAKHLMNSRDSSHQEASAISRRGFLKNTLGYSALLLSGPLISACAGLIPSHRRPIKTHHDTIAHAILDVELEHNKSKESYILLDEMIDVAKKALNQLPPKNAKDAQSAVTVLNTMARVINAYGFEYHKNALLSHALKTRKIDCDGYSSLYLAMGEALGYPIRIVRAPAHTFIRWHQDDRMYINWETTLQAVKADYYYLKHFKISASVDGISAMRSLDPIEDRDQILANAFMNCGVEYFRTLDFDKAIRRFDNAIKRDPLYEAPYYNKGLAYYHQGEMEDAIFWCEKAIALNPNHTKSHAVLGTAYKETANPSKARIHFKKVEELDPEFYADKVYEMRISKNGPSISTPVRF